MSFVAYDNEGERVRIPQCLDKELIDLIKALDNETRTYVQIDYSVGGLTIWGGNKNRVSVVYQRSATFSSYQE